MASYKVVTVTIIMGTLPISFVSLNSISEMWSICRPIREIVNQITSLSNYKKLKTSTN